MLQMSWLFYIWISSFDTSSKLLIFINGYISIKIIQYATGTHFSFSRNSLSISVKVVAIKHSMSFPGQMKLLEFSSIYLIGKLKCKSFWVRGFQRQNWPRSLWEGCEGPDLTVFTPQGFKSKVTFNLDGEHN